MLSSFLFCHIKLINHSLFLDSASEDMERMNISIQYIELFCIYTMIYTWKWKQPFVFCSSKNSKVLKYSSVFVFASFLINNKTCGWLMWHRSDTVPVRRVVGAAARCSWTCGCALLIGRTRSAQRGRPALCHHCCSDSQTRAHRWAPSVRSHLAVVIWRRASWMLRFTRSFSGSSGT